MAADGDREPAQQTPTFGGVIEGQLYIAKTTPRIQSQGSEQQTATVATETTHADDGHDFDFLVHDGKLVTVSKPVQAGKDIVSTTHSFEDWLKRYTPLNKADLRLKHANMAQGMFPFFRATFYRWLQIWPKICPEYARAPSLLAIGDLTTDSFGTWRDTDGRLIWGVTRFDEALVAPYTNDLLRIATSVRLAIGQRQVVAKVKDALDALLNGYSESLRISGQPFILAEENAWLREIALGRMRDPVRFWAKLDSLPSIKEQLPKGLLVAIEKSFPSRNLTYRLVRRVAGLGSLGRFRVVAIAHHAGGRIAREARALLPPSSYWAHRRKGDVEILYRRIIRQAVRSPDHHDQLRDGWLVKRLSPDCCHLELASTNVSGATLRLFYAMGWETGNIHLGTPKARETVLRHLKGQESNWLSNGSKAMAEAVESDWQVWRKKGF